MRVSLKDLFAVTAFGAVMAWFAGEAGVDNGLFWVVLLVAAVMSVAFVSLAKNEHGRWLTLLVSPAAFFFCAAPLASVTLLYISGFLFVAGLVFTILPRRSVRTLTGVAMLCLIAAFAGGVVDGWARLADLRAMQREFPVASLASRLEYERGRAARLPQLTLAPEVDEELVDWEQCFDSHTRREHQLRRLHDRQYELFVRASGFGVGRMMRPYPEGMRLTPLRDIPFNAIVTDEPDQGPRAWRGVWQAGRANDVEHLHLVSRDDFLDGDGFGATLAPLTQVAGFIEHALHHPPTAQLEDPLAWSIERLELVSLLKFDEPRVYVLDHLPRMDQLAANDAPTRGLDEFEAAALAALRTDEDVVVAEGAGEVRMMGSLRAGSQCMDCHSVPRGTLLGAFSYVLRRGEMRAEVLAQRGGEIEAKTLAEF